MLPPILAADIAEATIDDTVAEIVLFTLVIYLSFTLISSEPLPNLPRPVVIRTDVFLKVSAKL